MAQVKRFSWTLNNYTDEDIERLKTFVQDQCDYIGFGKEVGELGTPHLQGYIETKKRMRVTGFNKLMNGKWFNTPSKGTAQENITYCKKQGEYYEFGSIEKNSGARNDLQAFQDCVKGGCLDKKRLREDFPEVSAKYPRFVDNYIRDQLVLPKVPDHSLKPWQQSLLEKIDGPAESRTVNFIVDSKGNQGKSWFAKKYMESHSDSYLLRPGKHADMAHALPDVLRVLFIDATRKQVEYMPYTLLEELKDGLVMSTKYETCVKRYPDLHVVVLMNQHPDMEALSTDRYCVINLDDPPPAVVPSFVPHPWH